MKTYITQTDYIRLTTEQLQNEIDFQETFGRRPLRMDEDELEQSYIADLDSDYWREDA